MPERDDEKRRKLDLDGELGISRRDMLRRSAVAGGTLLWVAPAIQSLAPAASAQTQNRSPGKCSACYCWNQDAQGNVEGNDVGLADNFLFPGDDNADDCENWCKHQGQYNNLTGAPGGPYQNSDFCSGESPCSVTEAEEGTPPGHVTCG